MQHINEIYYTSDQGRRKGGGGGSEDLQVYIVSIKKRSVRVISAKRTL